MTPKQKFLSKGSRIHQCQTNKTLRETAFFSGAHNPIQLSRDFNEKFKCDFNLRYFPFDTQTCMILINANNKVKNFVQLTPVHMEYIGPRNLLNFEVVSWEAEMDTTDSPVHIRARIVIKRKVTQILVGIYFPSLCIMIIAQVCYISLSCFSFKTEFQATLCFKREHFKISIPVAITAMLVMYTLNNSVSSKLPQTSMIKFVDIWICYGLFLHFVILLLFM